MSMWFTFLFHCTHWAAEDLPYNAEPVSIENEHFVGNPETRRRVTECRG